jgi:hypothetical protein
LDIRESGAWIRRAGYGEVCGAGQQTQRVAGGLRQGFLFSSFFLFSSDFEIAGGLKKQEKEGLRRNWFCRASYGGLCGAGQQAERVAGGLAFFFSSKFEIAGVLKKGGKRENSRRIWSRRAAYGELCGATQQTQRADLRQKFLFSSRVEFAGGLGKEKVREECVCRSGIWRGLWSRLTDGTE